MNDNKNNRSLHSDTASNTNIKTDTTQSGKNYFASMADKYSKVSHILYIALAVCFIATLVFNARLLTYSNFSYLLKDIDTAFDVASQNFNSISYTNDDLRVTKNFRGGLVTASTTDMAIYTATGKKTLHINENFVSPDIAVSQKYAVVYDLGGNNYSIYNSFARVYNDKTKAPISFITVADNGWYAIASKDNEHTSVVYLYNDDFKLKNTYSFANKYVFSVSINERGNRIAVITTEAAPEGDKFSTHVMICEPGEDSAKANVFIGNGIPLGSAFSDNGDLHIVCNDGLYVIDENDGALKNSFSFSASSINRISVGANGCAIALSDNSATVKYNVLVFDKNGNMVYNTIVSNGIQDLEYFDEYIFIRQSDAITKINIKNQKVNNIPIYEKGSDIIVYNGNNIILCCQTKAKYIKI